LYGTAAEGGSSGHGTVFEITPAGLSNWTFSLLHDFTTDGWAPYGGVIWGQSGNLYGNTTTGGAYGSGVVFELTPSGGGWTFQDLYAFNNNGRGGPIGPLAIDAAGNLYGTTDYTGAYGNGSVYKLSYSNGTWTYTDLYDFIGGPDGCHPYGGVAVDHSGNLFGTTWDCGGGYGVVWEISQ